MKEKQDNLLTRQAPPAQDTIRNINAPLSGTYDEKLRQEYGEENGKDRQDNVNVLRNTESHISINRRNSISADRLTEKVSNLTNPHEIETEVGKAEEITGDGEELRRLFEFLQEKEENLLVCKICQNHFERVQINRGGNGGYLLLAHWFKNLVKFGVGKLDNNEESARRYAKSFPMQDWDIELFKEYIMFLLAKLRDHQSVDSVLTDLEESARKCTQMYPLDETGYYGLAKLWLYGKKKYEAKAVLHEAIFEMQLPLDPGQNPVYIRCPQCCLLLLSEMEENGCDPKWIIWTANRAVDYSDVYDKHDKVYVLYRLADAMERLKPRRTELAHRIYQEALKIIGDNAGEFGGRTSGKDYPRRDYCGILKIRLKPIGDIWGEYIESLSENKKILF